MSLRADPFTDFFSYYDGGAGSPTSSGQRVQPIQVRAVAALADDYPVLRERVDWLNKTSYSRRP
jgi:hypothetical protein